MPDIVIVDDHGDIEFYCSFEQACMDLEVVDARNQEFVAYDAKGHVVLLEIAVDGRRETVVLKRTDEDRSAELRTRLAAFFKQVSNNDELESMSLGQLVQFGTQFFGLQSD